LTEGTILSVVEEINIVESHVICTDFAKEIESNVGMFLRKERVQENNVRTSSSEKNIYPRSSFLQRSIPAELIAGTIGAEDKLREGDRSSVYGRAVSCVDCVNVDVKNTDGSENSRRRPSRRQLKTGESSWRIENKDIKDNVLTEVRERYRNAEHDNISRGNVNKGQTFLSGENDVVNSSEMLTGDKSFPTTTKCKCDCSRIKRSETIVSESDRQGI